METVNELRKSLAKAEAELNRTQQAYSVCLLTSDHAGCTAEQEAVNKAEREVSALRRRIDEAARLARRAEGLEASAPCITVVAASDRGRGRWIMRWYDVKIQGRYNGKPCEVDETVEAPDEEIAIRYALQNTFHVPYSHHIGWEYAENEGYPGPRPLVFILGERGRLVTDHEHLSDVVAEADPVRVAKLTGAPELPLDLEEETA